MNENFKLGIWIVAGICLGIILLTGIDVLELPTSSFSNARTSAGAAKTVDNAPQGELIAAPSQDIQRVTLTFKNWEYQFEPRTLQRGVPVRMDVDLSTVNGCLRDIVIPSFGVRKYVSPGDNIIEFTPTKSGTFNIACSMNMGRGTFEVT